MAILTMTISRGVILAVFLSVGLVFILSPLKLNLTNRNLTIIFSSLLIVIVFILILINYFIPYMDTVYTEGQIVNRIMSATSNPNEDPRWIIWSDVVSKLSWEQWIIGTGPGTFTELSDFDQHAHSIYLDIIITMGLAGILLFLFLFIKIGIQLWLHKDLLGIALLIYILASFATTGALPHKQFWILLGVLYGMSCKRVYFI
jgi:O-antigen ligase